eukprot:TRINITY_DN22499_c0_g1_i2.p1 TRINITY_DN22499_c0_g1~~TRINITY_DN22499_c0_g1_i2.p1  ORF type:complete len:380 (+),score=9.51 TRINITY_DN22499_c0_g1_i2:129-1268(+)
MSAGASGVFPSHASLVSREIQLSVLEPSDGVEEGRSISCASQQQARAPLRRQAWKKYLCISVAVLSLLIVSYFSLGYYVASRFVHLRSRAFNVTYFGEEVNPENIDLKVHSGYQYLGSCVRQKLLDEFYNFSSSAPWKLVRLPSRPGSDGQDYVSLRGWWLPAVSSDTPFPDDIIPPRIVLVHGYGMNFNDQTVQFAGYFLRSVGFSVLIINLRDHGVSQNSSTHFSTWGWAYYLDALGGWDYAVQDPDGLLGGSLPPEQVGMMGFSMGGFATATALGEEPRIPAAWLDSPAFDVQEVLQANTALVIGNVLASMVIPAAMMFTKFITGVDLSHTSPEVALSKRPLLTNCKRRSIVKSYLKTTRQDGHCAPLLQKTLTLC